MCIPRKLQKWFYYNFELIIYLIITKIIYIHWSSEISYFGLNYFAFTDLQGSIIASCRIKSPSGQELHSRNLHMLDVRGSPENFTFIKFFVKPTFREYSVAIYPFNSYEVKIIIGWKKNVINILICVIGVCKMNL